MMSAGGGEYIKQNVIADWSKVAPCLVTSCICREEVHSPRTLHTFGLHPRSYGEARLMLVSGICGHLSVGIRALRAPAKARL